MKERNGEGRSIWNNIVTMRDNRLCRGKFFLAHVEAGAWEQLKELADESMISMMQQIIMSGDKLFTEAVNKMAGMKERRGRKEVEGAMTKADEERELTTKPKEESVSNLNEGKKNVETKETTEVDEERTSKKGSEKSAKVADKEIVKATKETEKVAKETVEAPAKETPKEDSKAEPEEAKKTAATKRKERNEDTNEAPKGKVTEEVRRKEVILDELEEEEMAELDVDSLKKGEDLAFGMAIMIGRPQALIVCCDLPLPHRDQATLNAIEHVAGRRVLARPRFVKKGAITVTKPTNGCGMIVWLELEALLRCDMSLLRARPGRRREHLRFINNFALAEECPILFGITSEENAPGQRVGVHFLVTLKGARYIIDSEAEVAIHRFSRREWWVEVRGWRIMAFNGWGEKQAFPTPEQIIKSGVPVYPESVFGREDLEEKDEEEHKETSRTTFPNEELLDPFVVAPSDSKRIIEDERAEIFNRDLDWTFPDDIQDEEEEAPEEPQAKKTKVEWASGNLMMDKAMKLACKAIGRNAEDINKDSYGDIFKELLENAGAEVVKSTRNDRPLPTGGARGARGRGAAGMNTRASARGGRGGAANSGSK